MSAAATSAELELELHGEAETAALGGALARLLEGGEVVLLLGDLGAGKTTLVKGVVEALAPDTLATSPSFALCHLYDTTPPIAHVDCWRMDGPAELSDLVLDELLEEGASVLVEWGELAADRFGADALVIELDAPAPDRRRARLRARGAMGTRLSRLALDCEEAGLCPRGQRARPA